MQINMVHPIKENVYYCNYFILITLLLIKKYKYILRKNRERKKIYILNFSL